MKGSKPIRVLGVANALTDFLIYINHKELDEMRLVKGGHQSLKKINGPFFNIILGKSNVQKFLGGGPTNTIRGINNLGMKCSLIGAVGEDETGEYYLQSLSSEGIQPHFNKVSSGESGKCYVFITPDGERSFVIDKGVYSKFPSFESDCSYNLFHTSGYELDSNPEIVLSLVKSLKKRGTKISLDLASNSVVKNSLEKFRILIKNSDIIFATSEERSALGGLESDLIKDKIIILKKGESGSEVYHTGKRFDIPCVESNKLVNTNGAGDSYAAGFLVSYLQGKDLEECGHRASLIASKVCSQEESWFKG